MSCFVIGDSLAVGTAIAMPECHAYVRTGVSSGRYLRSLPVRLGGDMVVISLGVNDWGHGTYCNLQYIRAGVSAARVVWLLPNAAAGVRGAIARVAAEHGDRIVDTAPFAPPLHLHPSGRGYRAIADLARRRAIARAD